MPPKAASKKKRKSPASKKPKVEKESKKDKKSKKDKEEKPKKEKKEKKETRLFLDKGIVHELTLFKACGGLEDKQEKLIFWFISNESKFAVKLRVWLRLQGLTRADNNDDSSDDEDDEDSDAKENKKKKNKDKTETANETTYELNSDWGDSAGVFHHDIVLLNQQLEKVLTQETLSEKKVAVKELLLAGSRQNLNNRRAAI